MAEQKEVSGSDWADRLEKIITGGLLLLTLLYGRWIYQVFGRDVWDLTQNNKMGEAGDFIAGFTTPVVFLWLIYGYFLQRRELGLQRKELYETQKTLGKQAEVMERQADAERLRSMPNLSLRETGREVGPSGQRRNLELLNFGSPAHDLEITRLDDNNGKNIVEGRSRSLDRGKAHKFSTPFTAPAPDDHSYHYAVVFNSESQDTFYQGWTIEISDENFPAVINEAPSITLLRPGQSPPSVEFG